MAMCWRSGLRSPGVDLIDICFSREMGFTRAEFLRILPAAFGDHLHQIESTGARAAIDEGQLQIRISEQKYRKIASISLPYLEVDFSFSGLKQERVDEVMRFFDLRYQRGGG